MNEKKVHIDKRYGAEFEGDYLFKEMFWGKKSHIMQKYTKYNQTTGVVESTDLVSIQAASIIACLHSQPQSKPLTFEKLLSEDDGIPQRLGEFFAQTVNELNGISREDLGFLLEQLSEDDRTQLLQNIGYAKSSVVCPLTSPNNQPEKSSNSS